ncbi:HlyD family secretion protein [Leptolinea tardivitalis]|uniref:HlyD family secretion protein n=1 Tax=Leptolinea tardivitalis TaxID=229920 RepID=UPI000781EE68|nr:HlyD family efflux transporter periplasmic adaptor subunit [Leptolinea tardivitalis]GAP20781.1 multidrug resistance efflux pump [Leptolinea tardivitalis]
MKTKNIYRVIYVLAFMSIFTLSACGAGTTAKTAPTPAANTASETYVSATGVVIPIRWTLLSVPTSGVVEKVTVQENQAVNSGDILVSLKGKAAQEAAVSAAEVAVLTAQRKLDDLSKNHNVVRAAAQQRLANAVKALDKAQEKREGKNYQRASTAILDQAKADMILAEDEFKKASDLWAYYQDRDENDITRAGVLSMFSAARLARDKASWNLNYLQSLPDDMEVAQAEGDLVVAKAELEDAQKEWDRVKNGPDPRDEKQLEGELNNARKQLEAARSALADLDLKAPFSGTTSQVSLREGEWVNPGQKAMLLADLSQFQVETTDLNEIDVARIKEGAPVEITFDAITNLKIQGVVERIAARSSEGSGVNYTVTISMDERPEKLRWGMTAFVDIKVEE